MRKRIEIALYSFAAGLLLPAVAYSFEPQDNAAKRISDLEKQVKRLELVQQAQFEQLTGHSRALTEFSLKITEIDHKVNRSVPVAK